MHLNVENTALQLQSPKYIDGKSPPFLFRSNFRYGLFFSLSYLLTFVVMLVAWSGEYAVLKRFA
jgi:hypothetical protein